MSRSWKLLIPILSLATIVVISSAWAADPWKAPARAAKKKNPIAADDASIAAGKQAYVKECMPCHGETGKGDGTASGTLEVKPGDLSNPKMTEQTDGELFWKITEGKKPMPSYQKLLTDDERWQTVNYIRTFVKSGAPGK